MLDARGFASEVLIVDSDRESVFSNDRYYDFLKGLNVTVSLGSSKAHQNQVVERLHRSLKDIIRADLKSVSLSASKPPWVRNLFQGKSKVFKLSGIPSKKREFK